MTATYKNVTYDFAGEIGIKPRLVRLDTDGTLSEITTAGFINYPAVNSDMVAVNYSDGQGWFKPTISTSGVITLNASESDVILPTTTNQIATFANSQGGIKNGATTIFNLGNISAGQPGSGGGFNAYDNTAGTGHSSWTHTANSGDYFTGYTNAPMGQDTTITTPDPGAATANFIISKSAGTQQITSGNLQVSAGSLTTGASGAAGDFKIYPATAAKGYLEVKATNNTGDTATIITNAAMGQASTITIPDPAAAAANMGIIDMTPIPGVGAVATFSTTTGRLKYSPGSFRAFKATDGTGGTSIVITDANVTAAHVVNANIESSTNAVSIQKVTPGSGNITITFSGDTGANVTVAYTAVLQQ